MPITHEQELRIEELVARDPEVRRAFDALGRANVCDERVFEHAQNNFAAALDNAVERAAERVGVNLTERQSDRIENRLGSMMTEGMGGRPVLCR